MELVSLPSAEHTSQPCELKKDPVKLKLKLKMWHPETIKECVMPKRPASSSRLDDTGLFSVSTDDEKEIYEVQKQDILYSITNRYLVRDFAGEGCFGKVVKCENLLTSQNVALKILKTKPDVDKREVKMLEALSVLDPGKKNVVKFFEMFQYKGHTCLAFEMLDRSLLQLIKDRHFKPLSPSEIRPVAQQLLTAFDALKGIGVIHADLKPDNIMLVNHQDEPFRVKLIDFGLAFTTSEEKHRKKIQPLGYRSPEATLGLPISEAIDMWGLGCVLAFLYLGNHLFSTQSEYRMIRDIVKIVGQPADHLLHAGTNTHKFFKMIQQKHNPKWKLKTPGEYQHDIGFVPKRCTQSIKSLDDLVTMQSYPNGGESTELVDKRTFVKLLKCLLDTDPEKRITAQEALKHPFVTMSHLEGERVTSFYADRAFHRMLVCPMDKSEEELSPDGELPSGSPGCCWSWKFIKLKLQSGCI